MIKSYIKEIGLMLACAIIALVALYPGGPLMKILYPSGANATDLNPQLASQSYVGDGAAVPGEIPAKIPSKSDEGSIKTGAVTADPNGALFHGVVDKAEAAPILPLHGAMIADLGTGEVYYEKHAENQWPMASVTKLLTASVAMKFIPPTELITVGPDVQAHLGEDGGGQLKTGEQYSASDLLKALLTFSSNEAAETLASYIGRDSFIATMNATAQEWGLTHTNVSDPTGLGASNQSTPDDLLILTRKVYETYPSLFTITRTQSTTILDHTSGKSTTYANINQFAGTGSFIGGKTGYTDEAMGNLVSLFAYENRTIFVVVLGTEDRFGNTQSLIDWFKRTHTMK
jgi:serine-type D-Ala-D-Ala carboxypeptidase (penicillin-binding protein 5/6)